MRTTRAAGNMKTPWLLYTQVFNHVRASYAWWNLTDGRNHVVWANADRGVCRLDAYPQYVSADSGVRRHAV